MIYLETPLTVDKIKQLHAGDEVYLSGTIYTGRDAAHKRLIQLLDEGKKLPFDIQIKPSSMLDQLLPNQDKFLVVEDQQLQEEWMLIHQD